MDKPQPLSETREQITDIDNTVLQLLARRRELSLEVARSKEVDVRPVRDTQRERELLARLVQKGREQGLDPHFVMQLYQSIIEDSVLNQQAYLHGRANPETQKQQYCIAYLGARGSYSYLAANRYCQRRQVDMVDLGCQSFDEIVQAVESGHADYGFLPIENTSSGSINEVYDVLQHTSLAIVGETTIEVGHCLLAKPGTKASDIKTLYAHPQPISQCSRYLARHPGVRLEYCASSAEAMEKVQAAAGNDVAAIGSAEGGALYQLEAIEKGLANQKVNQSRFIVVARKAVAVPEQLPAKCTLIMATGQKPGALVEALLVLKANNLNMSKLESRPIPGTPWEEMFYLDIDANLASPPMQLALKELERITRFIKVLGCYPCETVAPTQLSNAQLLIEPEHFRADAPPATKPHPSAAEPARHSLAYKASLSEAVAGSLLLGNGHTGALAQLPLPQTLEGFEPFLKQIKAAGFAGLVLSQLAEQPNPAKALDACAKAAEKFGLITAAAIDKEEELEHALSRVELILIKGKQMFNRPLLERVGKLHLPVVLERNTMADIDELLGAADIILGAGNQQLMLCESGVSSFKSSSLATLDLAGLVELKARSHLPVLVNPSYAVSADACPRQAKAVKHLGADGLVLDVTLDAPIADNHIGETLRQFFI
ncbi:chorismate mutase [Shewanella sp. JM162201]|uniref:Chorismate mutase n=1 Tax=Shewanella jiangmenensis TaxID=2837387 RepID=A0ABS5V663_9GAMM|nr:chorismate mutase [Shewanella jiangmenensis]MBT1444523.1 chorismate mutase [Shewanella jiangmenensis]